MIERERLELLKDIDSENEKLSKMLESIEIDKLCEVKYLLNMGFVTQCYALNYLVKNISPNFSLSKRNVGQIIKILKSSKPNGQFQIIKGLYLFKEYEYFEFGMIKVEPKEFSYPLICPGVLDTPYFYLNFRNDASDRTFLIIDLLSLYL